MQEKHLLLFLSKPALLCNGARFFSSRFLNSDMLIMPFLDII